MASSSSSSSSKKVGYITDIEGNWEYFQNYVALSSIIEYDSKDNLIFKEDNTLLVFGGDVCDKGNGSIRITKQLVAFKKKYPERVILILGNRDINKMRWTSELAPSEIDNVDNVPGPYWVKKESQVSPKQYVTKLADAAKVPFQSANTLANRIKWMLEATMGAAGDFDRRRTELATILKKKNITDDQVVASYMDSVKPNGEMFEFLSLGQLAFIHEGTLFVHGGVTRANIGYVPYSRTKFNNISEWVTSLNEWYKLEFLEWTLKPRWDYQKESKLIFFKYGEKFNAAIQGIPTAEADLEDKSKWTARGAHRLMDYALPTAKGSVVYSHMFNKLNNCQPVDEEVRQQLTNHGVFRIVTGHQPHGNAPAVNKFSDDFEVIDCDSSYSDMTAADNRGKAVSEVVLMGRKAFVKGALNDSSRIEYQLSMDRGEGDPYIGRKVPLQDDKEGNSFWVKAKLATTPADGKEYLICKVTGFAVSYDYMTREKLDEIIYNRKIVSTQEDVCSITINAKEVPITKLASVTDCSLREVIAVPFFDDWLKKIQSNPDLKLKKVEIQSVDRSDFRIRFIKLNATIKNKKGDNVSGVIFLRGNSVAVLCILEIEDGRKLVVAVKHPRSPVGSSDHLEIPIGMEEHKSPLGVIRNLLQNESGIELETDTAINLSQYLFNNPERPIYVSPGSCDQGVRFFLIEKGITDQQLRDIQAQAKATDQVSPYETVLVPLENLEEQCNDGNAIIAARLYDLYLRKRAREEALATPPVTPPSSPVVSSPATPSPSSQRRQQLTSSADMKKL